MPNAARTAFISGLLLMMNCAAMAQLPEEPYWIPDGATIKAMEAEITLPSWGRIKSGPLESYVRYYTGATLNGHRIIQGTLLASDAKSPAGIHIMEHNDFINTPGWLGGGCSHITISYDLDDRKFLYKRCYGPG